MPHPYAPGLPVLSDAERARRNALQQEWNSPFKDSELDQRPSLASLYEDEPTTEELLAQAQSTLDATAPRAAQLSGAGEIARRGITSGPQSAEMHAPEPEYGYGDLAKDVVVGASIPASFLAGPVGMAAGAIQGIDALASGNPIGAGFAAIPAMRSLKGAKGLQPTGAGAKGPFSPYPRPPQIDPPVPPRTYQLGPEKTLEEILGSPSIASLRDDIAEGAQGGAVDLTGALDDLGEASLSPAEIARARAAERFGKPYRSEVTSEPSIAPMAEAPAPVRALSEGEERGIQELDDLLTAIHGDAAPRGNGTYVEPEDGKAALQRIIDALYGLNPSPSVSRMTAQQALEEGDEIGKRSVLFGGASSSDEGTFGNFVRPKDRTPIGSRPPRRGEGDEAIRWNQR